MKSRLAAISYPLYAGGRGIGTKSLSRVAVSAYDEVRTNGCFQAQEFERFTHSSAVEDDDDDDDDVFGKLGAEIECSSMKIKLATEKPDHYADYKKSNNHTTKGLVDQPSSSNSIKDLLATIGKTLESSNPKKTRKGIASTSTISEPKEFSSVSIKNVPSTVTLSQLVEVVSQFGEVSGASFESAPDDIKSCNVVFKDEDSGRKAISTGKVSVKGQVLSIQSMDDGVSPIVSKFRIKNINKETSDYAIHSQCMSAGELVGLSRISDDVVDVFFNVSGDKMNMQILSRLNNKRVDSSDWSARVITTNSSSSEACSADRAMDLQIFDRILELRKETELRKVQLRDLRRLNESIMHIKDLFSSIDPSPKS